MPYSEGPYAAGYYGTNPDVDEFLDTTFYGITRDARDSELLDAPKWEIGVKEALAVEMAKVQVREICILPPPTIGLLAPRRPLQGGPPWGGSDPIGDPMQGLAGFLDHTRDFQWAYAAWKKQYAWESSADDEVSGLIDEDWETITRGWDGGTVEDTTSNIPGNKYTEWNDWYWGLGVDAYDFDALITTVVDYKNLGYVFYSQDFFFWNWQNTGLIDFAYDMGVVLSMENLTYYAHDLEIVRDAWRQTSSTATTDPSSKKYPVMDSAVGDYSTRFRTTYKWDGVPERWERDLRTRFKLMSGWDVVDGQLTVMDDWLDTQYAAMAASLYYSVVPKQFTAKMQKGTAIPEEDLSALVTYGLASNVAAAAIDTSAASTSTEMGPSVVTPEEMY